MIRIRATDFGQFLAAHAVLRAAGVDVIAAGGNEASVPDDTDLTVLRAVAATGAVVDADLTDTDDEEAAAEKPARKPRKTTTRRTSTKE